YCQAITMEGQGSTEYGPSSDVVSGNTFKSNLYMIRTEGYDGITQQDAPLDGNAWEWEIGSDAYTDFAAAMDDKLGALGMTDTVGTSALQEVNNRKAAINAAIGTQGLQATRAFWF